MTYKEWSELEKKERERLLEAEKQIQKREAIAPEFEPEHIYLGVIRPRPKSAQVLDQIL